MMKMKGGGKEEETNLPFQNGVFYGGIKLNAVLLGFVDPVMPLYIILNIFTLQFGWYVTKFFPLWPNF